MTKRLCQEVRGRLEALPLLDARHVRRLRREISDRIVDRPRSDVLDLACALHRSTFYLRTKSSTFTAPSWESQDPGEIELLGRSMDTWGAVDCFGVYVAGPVWRNGRLEDEVVETWASSSSRWWRRAALVSTIPLNSRSRSGEGDAGRTLAICRLLIADRDKLVVGALFWALRELAKRDPKAVWSFLHENESTPPQGWT